MGQTVSAEKDKPYHVTIPNQGTLTGYSLKSAASDSITTYRFGNVPYAVPSGAAGRFKKPQAIPKDFNYTGDYLDLGMQGPQATIENPIFEYTEAPSDENIQYVNIWTPSDDSKKPKNGWPVLVYIHGGWLQYGTPSSDQFNTNELFDNEFHQKFILVSVGYRLNIFGFLSGTDLLEEDPESSNFGFWDQRLAIEWTYENIQYFGGDPEKITVLGLSAGAYSVFFQLTYELYHPEAKQIIKQIVLFSNTPIAQPKTINETKAQFDEVIDKFGIDKSLTGPQKLEALRKLDTKFIVDKIPQLEHHTFRAVSDDFFVPLSLIADFQNGKYAEKLKAKNVRIISGEVNNEQYTYSIFFSPTNLKELELQVNNYYPEKVSRTFLDHYLTEKLDESSPDFEKKLVELYGKIVSDGQVYVALRGFLSKMVEHGFPKDQIFRFRIDFRAKFVEKFLPVEHKVPHGSDIYIWFYTLREGFTPQEQQQIQEWLRPYLQFLSFDKEVDWPNSDIDKFRHLNLDGTISYDEDPVFSTHVAVANKVYNAQL